MRTITIDGRNIAFTDEPNILSIIRKSGIDLPTLCYHSELSVYGACRLCTVEDHRGRTFASCSEQPRDGMVIYTNTPRLIKYRRMIVQLLLAAHDRDCTSCIKNGDCTLQSLAKRLGVLEVPFESRRTGYPVDFSSPAIVRNPNKCILCGDCVRVCDNVQGINAIDFAYRGTEAMVTPAFQKTLRETDCINCGQCRIVCPTGAISIHTNKTPVWAALSDPDTRVVAQIAPAVRIALGDTLGLPHGKNVMGLLVAALHRMGFDEVYDTTLGADLTVIEESSEFLKRLQTGERLPLFTSCCPGWVSYCEMRHRELVPDLSTCRSPMQMLGAVLREYYKDPEKSEGKKLISVAIMPCTAKKDEILRPESRTGGIQDVDYVLTTAEVAVMIQTAGIKFDQLEAEACDMPFGIGSGAGVIFGNTGGVMEAVLRRLAPTGKRSEMDTIRQSGVRGEEGIKIFSFPYQDRQVRAAVVSGLAMAEELIRKIRSGEESFDIVEVMACRRGCVMGGGQPLGAGPRTRAARAKGLYEADHDIQIKKSDDNPIVMNLYQTVLKGREHELLHRNLI